MTGTPDTRLLDTLIDRKINERLEQSSLKGGGGGGTSDGMEERVKRVEQGIGEVKVILGRLEPAIKNIADEQKEQRGDVKKLISDVGELKGGIGKLPSTVQLIGFVLVVLGVAGALRIFG